ncbi:hypothetical protein LXL04_008078 [Taraxacum kok-saghyz]
MQFFQNKYPSKQQKHLQQEHSKTFGTWLQHEVYRDSQICKDSVTTTVDWLSHKPNINVLKYDVYAINGYTFCTKSRACKGYQDSGVSVLATDTHISKDVVTHVKNTYYGCNVPNF